jgi:hypothetical protein
VILSLAVERSIGLTLCDYGGGQVDEEDQVMCHYRGRKYIRRKPLGTTGTPTYPTSVLDFKDD